MRHISCDPRLKVLDTCVYEALGQLVPDMGIAVLPRLLSYTWYQRGHQLRYLRLFLHSSLETLRMESPGNTPRTDVAMVWDAVSLWSPALKSFTVSSWLHDARDETGHLSSLICALDDLQALDVVIMLQGNALTHISSLRNLKYLTIATPSADAFGYVPSCGGTFACLERLSLVTGGDADAIVSLIRSVTSTTLRSLSLPWFQISHTKLAQIIQAIAQSCFLQSLENVDLLLGTESPIGFETFAPLLAARSLQEVHLRGVDIGDEAIQVIAAAWPNLSAFGYTSLTPRVTLVGFLHFLEKCPHLRDLSECPVNLSVPVPDPTQLPEGLRPNLRVAMLSIGASVIQNPHSVALFLARYFPNVRRLYQVPRMLRLETVEQAETRIGNARRTMDFLDLIVGAK